MVVVTKVHEALVSKVKPGQKATIRVESFSGHVLRGEIESVATVAAQTDWMSADVKVYNTRVRINPDDMDGLDLKPGMSAEVTITVDRAKENVLTVPVQAVFGGSEMGLERKVIVMTPEGTKERTVKIGLNNDKYVEVKEGLEEGDEVVENPKAVVGDKVKTRDGPMEKGGGGGKGKGGPGGGGGSGKSKGRPE
jgi:multidrug efflux pump subunit AcrA (membrane-fusion protein)